MGARDRPAVPDWFGEWMTWHRSLHPRGPWPGAAEAEAFYLDWGEQFAERGVTEEEAREASRRLRRIQHADPRCPKCGALAEPFPTTHPALLLRIVSALRRERRADAAAAEPVPAGVEAEADERSRRWDAASDEERGRAAEAVRRANPGIERRTPGYFRLLCILTLSEPGAAEGLLRPAGGDRPAPAPGPRRPEPWWAGANRVPFVEAGPPEPGGMHLDRGSRDENGTV